VKINAIDRKNALRERTKGFAAEIVRLFVSLDRSREEIRVLGRQCLRSGTSVGAQYREASRARSPEEFMAKIDSCSQEADETQFWLELLRDTCGVSRVQIDPLWKECDELISIFVTMSKRTKENRSK
jgi:four helix bundle protein